LTLSFEVSYSGILYFILNIIHSFDDSKRPALKVELLAYKNPFSTDPKIKGNITSFPKKIPTRKGSKTDVIPVIHI